MGSNFNGRLDSCWGVGFCRGGLGSLFVVIVYTLRELRFYKTIDDFTYDILVHSVELI